MRNTLSYQAYMSSPYRSIKHTTYFEAYDKLFAGYIDKEIVFVEIGILSGGSLFMWRNFFGPKARIIGVDLSPNAKKWVDHGFEIYIGSQSDEKFWINFIKEVGLIDVVLDDGGHTYAQQIITTELLLPNIRNHGILVVEDTHTSYMKGFGPKRYSFIQYTKKMIDRINSRFSELTPGNLDSRVWSVQTFESIVAFHINKEASLRVSKPTDNNGIDDNAMDFRHFRNVTYSRVNSLAMDFMKRIPGILILNKYRLLFIESRKVKSLRLKKYFT